MKLQKLGGFVSIFWVIWVFALTISLQLLFPHLGISMPLSQAEPAKMLADYEKFPIIINLLHSVIILEGIWPLLIVLALHERMSHKAPQLMRLALIAVSIYAGFVLTIHISAIFCNRAIMVSKDISSYRAIIIILDGFDLASFRIWGCVLLLCGLAGFRTKGLSRVASYLILAYGIVSFLGFAIKELDLFRVIIFFPISMIWLGIYLIRNPEPTLE